MADLCMTMNAVHFYLWLPMIVIAFVNATLRELVITKYASPLRANQWSTIVLVFFCAIYVYYVFPFLRIDSGRQAFLVGLIWVVLTIIFEFALGRFSHKSWNELLIQYDVTSGNLWPLFLVCLFLMPYLCYTIWLPRNV
jgi:hypothetical protein